MQDLKDVTADVHYENYRANYLADQMKNTNKERKWVELLFGWGGKLYCICFSLKIISYRFFFFLIILFVLPFL